MAKSKLGLGYSPLSEKIYLGHTNTNRPNEWVGEKRDVTSDFIQVMLQKFAPDTESILTVSGKPKYNITVTTIEEEEK